MFQPPQPIGPLVERLRRAVVAKFQDDFQAAVVAARTSELRAWEKDPYVRKLRIALTALSWYVIVSFDVNFFS